MGGAWTQWPVWESPKSSTHSARGLLVLAAECRSQVPTPLCHWKHELLFPLVSSELMGAQNRCEERGLRGGAWAAGGAAALPGFRWTQTQSQRSGRCPWDRNVTPCCAGLSDCLGGGGESHSPDLHVLLRLTDPEAAEGVTLEDEPTCVSRGHKWLVCPAAAVGRAGSGSCRPDNQGTPPDCCRSARCQQV